MRNFFRRNESAASKASNNEGGNAGIDPSAEHTALSNDLGEVLDAKPDKQIPMPSPEGTKEATSTDPSRQISIARSWEARSVFRFPQAIICKKDIEFSQEGRMLITGAAAQIILTNAVLWIHSDHPGLRKPEAMMDLPSSDVPLNKYGHFDIIHNHIAHRRWTWIAHFVGKIPRIDFARTANMDVARMIFRHNTAITSPIVNFCKVESSICKCNPCKCVKFNENCKDPCRDVPSDIDVAKLATWLPELAYLSKLRAD